MNLSIGNAILRATVVTVLCCGALPLGAQSWEMLNGLSGGQEIKVRDTANQNFQGAFAAVTADGIRLKTRSGEVSIERARVRRVQVRSTSRRVLNTAIGAGIGLVLGIVLDQSLGSLLRNETGEDAGQRAVIYAAPIGVFGGLAALFPAYRTLYKVH